MINQLRRTYFWTRMSTDVQTFVASCPVCLNHKRSQWTEKAPIHEKEVNLAPGQVLIFDLVGPLPASRNYRHIFLGVDEATRMVYGFPLRSRNAKVIAREMMNRIFFVTGVFSLMKSDCAREFTGLVMTHLAELTQTTHVYSVGYTSIAQSRVERMNGVVVNALRCMVQKQADKWADHLNAALFGVNASPISNQMWLSPFVLDKGRLPKFPDEDHVYREIEACGYDNVAITEQHELMKQSFDMMHEIVKQRRDTDRRLLPVRSAAAKVRVGSLVFVKRPPRKKATDEVRATKMEPLFHGPFLVYKTGPENIVWLRDVRSGKYWELPIHVNRLKHMNKLAPELLLALLPNREDQVYTNAHVASDLPAVSE